MSVSVKLKQQSYSLGRIAVDVPVVLAPMVGLSHSAFRSLLMEIGGVGLLFTEMLAAKRLPYDSVESSPMLISSSGEHPLVYQIFLADEKPVNKAVAKLETLDVDGIDINLGCPAPQLRRRGAGGFLAEDEVVVRKIVSVLRKKTALNLSAKIRLGKELNKTRLINFCTMLEGEGIDFVTVHARLHGEKFCRTPRWEWIGLVKENVSIPVIANGGVFSVADAQKCLERSGADGIMLGRGGVEKPWLFAQIAMAIYHREIPVTFRTIDQVYYRFVDLLQERFRSERRLGRLKQFTHYLAQNFTFGHHLASSIQRCNSMEEAIEKSSVFFEKQAIAELTFNGGIHD